MIAEILALLLWMPQSAVVQDAADLVVVNGKVLTLDARSTRASAVAIRGGVFVLVGSDEEARKWVGPATRVLDAGGKSVIPGLIDSHVHSIGVARDHAVQPFVALSSIADIQAWVRTKAAGLPEGQWIRIPRCDVTRLCERRLPNREDLDAAAERHPVFFEWSYAGVQIQILNTAALEAAGIRRNAPAPAGVEVVKDAQGEPTGVLRNGRALLATVMPAKPLSSDALLSGLAEVFLRYNAVGITSIGERRTGVEGYRVFEDLKNRGRLTVRVNATIGLTSDGTEEGTEKAIRALPFKFRDGDDWLRVGSLKIAVDGGLLYGTAYLREAFGPGSAELYGVEESGYRGILSLSPEKVKTLIRTGHRLGWQMSSHVTGDSGVDVVLDAVEAADAERPIRDRRYTLIHAYLPNPETARRAAALGVCVDTQPAWYYKDADALVGPLGKQRLSRYIGLKTWIDGGVRVAINTDHMHGLDPNASLNPFNPFLTLTIAIVRKTEGGQVYGPEQRVSREQALRMLTIDAAYLNFDEGRKGSIEVGKLGDLAVLSEDYGACDVDRIRDIRVVATVVGGKVVHESK